MIFQYYDPRGFHKHAPTLDPVTKAKRDHRLNVRLQLPALVLQTDIAVVIHLNRNSHQVGEGAGHFLGKVCVSTLLLAGRALGLGKLNEHHKECGKKAKPSGTTLQQA